MNANPGVNSFLPVPLLLVLALLVAAVSSITAYNSWDSASIKNDGVQYLSTAKNMASGHGITTDTLAFGPHFQDTIPGPQTMWPPGYPVLIATLGAITGDFERAALAINITAHFLGALLLGLLLLRCGLPGLWALLGSSLFYLTFFQWTFVGGLLSEPVFSALILLSLCLLPDIRLSGNWRYLLCGISLALVLIVRHSAVIYIAGVGLAVFVLLCNQLVRRVESFRGLLLKCVLLGGPGVLLFAGLMLRVRLTTSSAISVHGTHSPENLYYYLSTVFSELGWFLGFYVYGRAIPVIVGKVMTIVFIALIVVWCILSLMRSLRNRKRFAAVGHDFGSPGVFEQDKRRNFRTVLAMVVIFHTTLFFLYFGYCMMTDIPLKFSRRYFFQIHSGLLLLFLCIIYSGSVSRFALAHSNEGQGSRAGLKPGVGFGLSVFLLFAVAQTHSLTGVSLVRERNAEMLRMLDLPLDRPIAPKTSVAEKSAADNSSRNPDTVRKLVDACFNTESGAAQNRNQVQREEGVIWSGQGQILHQYLRVPTIALANRYREAALDFEAFSREIETYNIRMLVMVPHWALENAWKIPGILAWAAAEDMPVLEVSGYADDLTRNTFIVFVDPGCAPGSWQVK